MGANITTFVDTLLAAVLLNNPPAFTIVFVEMFSVTCISLVILVTNYHFYQETILRFVGWIADSNRNLALFMIAIFTVPIVLMFV
jgi:hypothetical protein